MNRVICFASAIAICGLALSVDASERDDFLSSQVAPKSLVGTTLKCRVQPGPLTYHEDACYSAYAADGYTVGYLVFAPAGGSYSYQWQVPNSNGQSIVGGCTSVSASCVLSVTGRRDSDNTIGVTVTDLINGGSISDYASYSIPATCFPPGWPGPVYC